MNKERRWLKSVIAASQTPTVAMPWQRDARRKPEAMKSLTATTVAKPRALAAR